MSRLSKLTGSPIVVEIEGEKLEIYPLKLKNLPLLMNLQSKDLETQGVAMKKLIQTTLKNSVHDATDEEIENVSAKYFIELSEAILEANGLKDVGPIKKDQKPQE